MNVIGKPIESHHNYTHCPSEVDLIRLRSDTRVTTLVFICLTITCIFVNYDSGAIPATLANIRDEFNFSYIQMGMLGSLPYVGVTIVSLPVARQIARTSNQMPILFFSLVINMATCLIFSESRNGMFVLLSRIFNGASQAAFIIFAPIWVDEFAPRNRITLWIGILQAANVFGVMIGYLVSGFLKTTFGLGFRASLRILVCAMSPFVASLWLFMPHWSPFGKLGLHKYINISSAHHIHAAVSPRSNLVSRSNCSDSGGIDVKEDLGFKHNEFGETFETRLDTSSRMVMIPKVRLDEGPSSISSSISSSSSLDPTISSPKLKPLKYSSIASQVSLPVNVDQMSPKLQDRNVELGQFLEAKQRGDPLIVNIKNSKQNENATNKDPHQLKKNKKQQTRKPLLFPSKPSPSASSMNQTGSPNKIGTSTNETNKQMQLPQPLPQPVTQKSPSSIISCKNSCESLCYGYRSTSSSAWISPPPPSAPILSTRLLSFVSPLASFSSYNNSTSNLDQVGISHVRNNQDDGDITQNNNENAVTPFKILPSSNKVIPPFATPDTHQNLSPSHYSSPSPPFSNLLPAPPTLRQGLSALLHSPLYIALVLSLSGLYFVVTGVQYWSSEYFLQIFGPNSTLDKEQQVSEQKILLFFSLVAVSAPIMGVIAAGILIDAQGGYKTPNKRRDAVLIATLCGFLATISGAFTAFIHSFILKVVGLWFLLFFGGMILPPATGVLISTVPERQQGLRAFASATAMFCYNVLGYAMGSGIPGFIMDIWGIETGMRIVLLWSLFAWICMGIASLFAIKQHAKIQQIRSIVCLGDNS